MLKWYKILSLKIFIFSSIVFLLANCISDFARARQSRVENKNICNNFGNVDSKTIPSESIYFDEELQKKAIITDHLETIPLDYLTNAINIQNEHDLIAFQELYSDVCLNGNSGTPAIFEKITYVIREKQSLTQDILKNINYEEVVEVRIPQGRGKGFSSYRGMIKNILRKLGQEDNVYGLSKYPYPNENLKNFVESHFNDVEYKLYNSLKYHGDEFTFKDSVKEQELHKIKKEKKYLYIQIYTRNLAKLFDIWKDYDFKTQTFSTKFSEEWEEDDRFDMPKDLQIKISLKEAKYFKDLYIGNVDDRSNGKPIKVELLFKIENGFEDKIAWGDCSNDIDMIYWTKPPIETTCKVRMDLRRKRLNLIPVRYKIENSRDSKIYLNY
ncbi:hypothetical protein BEN44_19700 [Leptospira interrogans serovar Ricardi]|nr:hypothetical protein [Leptospira interrogans serovar Ricardi]